MKIKCDLEAALAEKGARWERFDTLQTRLTEAIRQATALASVNSKEMDWAPFSDADVRSALACACASVIGKVRIPDKAWFRAHPDVTLFDCLLQYDETEIGEFIDELRTAIDPKHHFDFYV